MEHIFQGKWITDAEFSDLKPRNVFHRQLDPLELPCEEHRNRHVLFRKEFEWNGIGTEGKIFVSADDYYKLYVNGKAVAQGPAPAYHFRYRYNEIDVLPYLTQGRNVIALHTLYQGLINRVWQSGDLRHGMILDLVIDGKTVVASDESFLTSPHTGYTEMGTVGYETQFMERYDSRAPEVGFEKVDFDDGAWKNASLRKNADWDLSKQESHSLVFETISPVHTEKRGNVLFVDFGSQYVGYLKARVRGKSGDVVVLRFGQELTETGEVRYALRATCVYEEEWVLKDGISVLDQFDYKAFRYGELILPEGAECTEITLEARHYPFDLKASLRSEFADDPELKPLWELCIQSQKYGVQEVIQDCMEREKGFYLGDGCYTALTHLILTHDDSMARKLIDDAFATSFITDTLMTCMDCSFMQEIAEYPLILVSLVLWHYRLCKDKAYLAENYEKVVSLLNAYRREYETDGILQNLDKWCVVEWPKKFRGGYDADLTQGQICRDAHLVINAYYLEAIRTANKIAGLLGLPPYRDETPATEAFLNAFHLPEKGLFCDRKGSDHVTLLGNLFPFAFGLCPDEKTKENILHMLMEEGISSVALFGAFPALTGLVKLGRIDLIRKALLDEGAWKRMLREGATTTFEAWGKDAKWNTSLFHLTFSYAAVFLSDAPLSDLFS